MHQFNLVRNAKFEIASAHAQKTGTGTSTVFDVSAYAAVTFLVYFTTISAGSTSHYFTFEVYEDTASPFAAEVAVDATEAANRVIRPTAGFDSATTASGNTVFRSDDATNQANKIYAFDVNVGLYRYMALRWTETGTADQTFSVFIARHGARHKPVA